MAAQLAQKAQAEWDPTGAARRFPKMASAERAHAMASMPGMVSTYGGLVGARAAQQFRVLGDGTAEGWDGGAASGTRELSFQAVAVVGPHTFLLGGFDGNGVETKVRRVNNATGELVTLDAGLETVRAGAGVAVDRCYLHVSGGFDFGGSPTTVETFRVDADGTLTPMPSVYPNLPAARDGHLAGMSGGALVNVGGLQGGVAVRDAVTLRVDAGPSTHVDVLATGRGAAATVVLAGGGVLVLGGLAAGDHTVGAPALSSSEVVNFNGSVAAVAGPPLLAPRGEAAAAVLPSGILVAGGCSGQALDASCADTPLDTMEWVPWGAASVGAYNNVASIPNDGGLMYAAREGPVAVFVGSRLYVGAGNDEGPGWEWRGLTVDGQLDSTSGSLSAPPIPRRGACAYQEGNRVWLLGGVEPSDAGPRFPQEMLECTFTATGVDCVDGGSPALANPRAWHTCAVSGNVLYVLGGTGVADVLDGGVLEVEQFDLSGGAPTRIMPVEPALQLTTGFQESSAAWSGRALEVLGWSDAGVRHNRLVFGERGLESVTDLSLVSDFGAAWSAVRLGPKMLVVGGENHWWVELGTGVATLQGRTRRGPPSHVRLVRRGDGVCAIGGLSTGADGSPAGPSRHFECAPLVR